MLDAFFAVKGQLFDHPLITSYRAEHAITDMQLQHCADGPKQLTVVFAPWHISTRLIHRLERKYLAHESDVLVCNFSPYILSHNAVLVKDSFDYIAATISQKINQLQQEYSYARVELVGYSLGNVMLGMTASKIHSFNNLTMVVPGSDLLNCLWYSIRTLELKKSLLRNNQSYEGLSQLWSELAPMAHIEALRGHKIYMILSSRDRYIPYRYGRALADELVRRNIPADVMVHRWSGHVWASLRHIMSRP